MSEEERKEKDLSESKNKEEKKKENKEIEKSMQSVDEIKKDSKEMEILELKDRLLRLAAEFDNYKKRVAKELDSTKATGKMELAIKLLPVLDEFELAIEAMKLNNESEKGIGMVFSNFIETLKKEGLREIDAKGIFDPYKHEIILKKNEETPYGTIIQVVRKGYSMNNIMIRPASVIISSGEKNKQEKEENKK